MEINERRLILLDNLIYLNRCTKIDDENREDITVSSVVNDLLKMNENDFKKEVTDDQFYYCGNMVNGMNAEEWKNVLTAIKNDDYLMNISQKHLSPFR